MKRSFGAMREKAELKQADVAKSLSVAQSTVSMWETGDALPRGEMLPKIATLYGCTVDELLRESIERESA